MFAMPPVPRPKPTHSTENVNWSGESSCGALKPQPPPTTTNQSPSHFVKAWANAETVTLHTHTFLLYLSSKDISLRRTKPFKHRVQPVVFRVVVYWNFLYERECFLALFAAATDTPNNTIENSFNSYWEVRSDRLTPFSLRTVCFVSRR